MHLVFCVAARDSSDRNATSKSILLVTDLYSLVGCQEGLKLPASTRQQLQSWCTVHAVTGLNVCALTACIFLDLGASLKQGLSSDLKTLSPHPRASVHMPFSLSDNLFVITI